MNSGRGGARKKVRLDDQRGGKRETTRPDAQARGPTPNLARDIRDVRTKLQANRLKLKAPALRELQGELGAALQDVSELLSKDDEWDGKEIL